jgi:6-pyruvoyltetrahydropterin/6-carboxytetrahydropterin synthase
MTAPSSANIVASAPFEAARRVDIRPDGRASKRRHGHRFVARGRRCANPVDDAAEEAFRHRLESVVAPLNHSILNSELDVPADENLARWMRGKMDSRAVESVGEQSPASQDADLDDNGHAHACRRFRFEAALGLSFGVETDRRRPSSLAYQPQTHKLLEIR